MTHSQVERAAITHAYLVADEYARRDRRPPYRTVLAALARATSRADLLEAAAVRHATNRRWESFDAVAALVGAGADPRRVYRQANT